MNHQEHPDSIDGIIKEVSAKDTHVLPLSKRFWRRLFLLEHRNRKTTFLT